MTWVLHPGGEAQYYLGLCEMIQVYDINTAQLWELGLCKKANDWMWQSHRESHLIIRKRSQTKDKRMLCLYF